MLDHYIQKNIVYSLALTKSLRFSELKPGDVENKLFNYHLKKVVTSGLVEKSDDGAYQLTPKGRRVGKDALKQTDHLINRVYSVIFIAIRRHEDGAWLLCRRKAHPLYNKIGFMHTAPLLELEATANALAAMTAKTGLTGTFAVRGSGYLRMFDNNELESFTHYTLVECNDAAGILHQHDELSEYFWTNNVPYDDPDLLPSIPEFIELLSSPGIFYSEKSLKSSTS